MNGVDPPPKTKVNKILKQKIIIKTRKLKNTKPNTFTVAIRWAWLGTAPRQRDWSSDSLVPLENMRTKLKCFGESFLLFMHLDHCAHLTKPNLNKLFIHIFIQIVCRKVQRISNIHKYLLHVGWHRKQEEN